MHRASACVFVLEVWSNRQEPGHVGATVTLFFTIPSSREEGALGSILSTREGLDD